MTDNNKARKSFLKAMEDLKLNRFAEAYTLLIKSFELDTNFIAAYYVIADVKSFNDQLEDAKYYYEKVIQKCPDYSDHIYYRLGTISYELGEFGDASQYFGKYVSIDGVDIEKLLEAKAFIIKSDFYHDLFSNPVPFDPQPVANLCTEKGEYLPILSPDNEIILFLRKYTKIIKGPYPDKEDIEEFTISYKKDNLFDVDEVMPAPFNQSSFNQGGASLSIDNNQIFITLCGALGNYGQCDIHTSTYSNGQWSPLENLGPQVNSERWQSQVSLAPDGNTLYFCSTREGGYGGYDIWKTIKDESGKWGAAINLGPIVNTEGDEKSPFIHPDNATFYFISNGRMGVGGMDIFSCKRLNEIKWTTPKNIGYPINSTADEIGFFVSTDGKYGYFSSDRPGGYGSSDIYSFKLHEDARPEKVLFLKGELKDEKDKILPIESIQLKNLSTEETIDIEVDLTTGKYVHVQIFDSSDYMLSVQKEGYFYDTQYISQDDSVFDKPIQIDLEVKKYKKGSSFTIDNIHFDTNKYNLKNESRSELMSLVDFMKLNKNVRISINGHTDNIGNEDDNLLLSQNRAKAVYEFIGQNGIGQKRLSYEGYGETIPVDDNETQSGRAKNRRTEIVILKK